MSDKEAHKRFLASISGQGFPKASPVLPKTRPPHDGLGEIAPPVPEPGSLRQLQLVVWHRNTHSPAYYSIPASGWRIDCETRHIIIGKGLPRKMIPLDNILSYDIEELTP